MRLRRGGRGGEFDSSGDLGTGGGGRGREGERGEGGKGREEEGRWITLHDTRYTRDDIRYTIHDTTLSDPTPARRGGSLSYLPPFKLSNFQKLQIFKPFKKKRKRKGGREPIQLLDCSLIACLSLKPQTRQALELKTRHSRKRKKESKRRHDNTIC